jgi:hypothetical protein
MSASSKPITPGRLLGLVMFSGFMLVVTALPLGVVLALQARYGFHWGWHWAILWGVVMAIAAAVVGSLFLCAGELIARRGRNDRRKADTK